MGTLPMTGSKSAFFRLTPSIATLSSTTAGRTISIGIVVAWSTRSVTLPNIHRANPLENNFMLYRWRTVCVFRIRLVVAGEDVMRTGHATRPAFAACQKLPHQAALDHVHQRRPPDDDGRFVSALLHER